MRERLTTRKLCVLLLLALWTLIPTAAQAQTSENVTLDLQQTSIQHLFSQIKKQTGYSFIISSDLARSLKPADVKAQNEPVRKVLDRVLGAQNCTYDIDGHTITVFRKVSGNRTRTVSGYVYDDQGDALPGVPVCIGESRVCTVTDDQGYYTFKIPTSACDLKFSYVGMKTQYVTVKAGTETAHQNVTMEPNTFINEVVVTGYQDISKPKMTGAVTTVSADQLSDRYTANIVDNLEGRVAGLSTYNGKLTIRGTSSMYAETSPLLVVDGIPVEGSIEDLNPYDIESVNVLKDAAATAIYGARASNGIIVITTKNAKKKGKIDIDFSANLTIQEKRNMDYADNFYMNASQQVDMESKYWDYYYFNNEGEVADPIGDTQSSLMTGIQDVYAVQWAYYQKALGNMTDSELQQTLASLKKNNYAKEYGDAVYRQQVMQQYNLSLRSRSDKFQSNLTFNYKHDNSGIINAGSEQFNVNYKGIYEMAPWLQATFSINGIYGKTRQAGFDYYGAYTYLSPWSMAAYESLYNSDGSLRKFYWAYDGHSHDYDLPEGLVDMGQNPVEELYNNTETTRTQHMRYHGNLLFKIVDGLTANAQFIYETDHVTSDWIANAESHAARSMRNAYSVYDGYTNTVKYLTPESGGFRRSTNTDGRYWTARGQLNYAKTFGKHDINALAGLEFRETKYNGSKSLMLGYDDQQQIASSQVVDFSTISLMRSSSYYMAMAGGYPADQFVYSPYIEDSMGPVIETLHRYASGYANLTYTYDEKYNVFGSWRKDYADVYGLNDEFRGKPLWSVGAGWLIHNEPFMKGLEWLNFLKLRASYGVTGNIYQGATSYMTAKVDGLNQYTNEQKGTIESPANPNLKWEQTRTTNVGIDFSLLDNRLRGALDYYNKVGKDLFSNRTLDPTTGYSSMFVNTASMRNNGIELQLTYDWFRAKSRSDVSWTTTYTMSYNKNEITEVENPSTRAYQLLDSPFVEGYPTSALWSWRFAGISGAEGEKGMTLWYYDNGNAIHGAASGSVDIMEYSGQTEPKTIMGMDNTVRWNGFSLSVLMAYYGGHVMRALEENETFGAGDGAAVPSYFLNAWTPENPTNTPGIGRYASTSIGSEPRYSDISVRKADFLKVRNIVIGYDLPESFIKPLGINRLALRFQIDNPKYLWVKNDVGVDPETLGIRNPSSFIFGLNVNL